MAIKVNFIILYNKYLNFFLYNQSISQKLSFTLIFVINYNTEKSNHEILVITRETQTNELQLMTFLILISTTLLKLDDPKKLYSQVCSNALCGKQV